MHYWFKAKRYGWGWYPCSWEGWLVLAVFIVVSFLTFRRVDIQSHSVSDTLYGVAGYFVLYLIALLVICVWKGERPRWRRG
ncbi:MAG TPA: hypothetical protein VJK51_02920 [Candidatus Nanoarchaeia archaeon]|nr:hypothetical protein [Candidatus Nanoarchaeia archaeon]